MRSQTCPCRTLGWLEADVWEPALGKGTCHQLSHRCDPRLSQRGGSGNTALNHPTAAAENRHSNVLSPPRRTIRSSFLGRKQGPVFVGFYSMQENKAQGNKGLFCCWNFFTFYPPLQNKAHQTSSIARPLWSRGSGTTIGDLIHPPILVPSGSFTDYQLNSHHAADQERDRTEGNNISPGDSHYQQRQRPSL